MVCCFSRRPGVSDELKWNAYWNEEQTRTTVALSRRYPWSYYRIVWITIRENPDFFIFFQTPRFNSTTCCGKEGAIAMEFLWVFALFLFSESVFLSFPWPSLKFPDFPGLETEIINSMNFQVFHNLYKPCTDTYFPMGQHYSFTLYLHLHL